MKKVQELKARENEDDKPTVVLDLNALKSQKLKQEEDLANIAQELEFAVGPEEEKKSTPIKQQDIETKVLPMPKANFSVILFDFQSDFFAKNKAQFPKGFNYLIAKNLTDLNKFLAAKNFQIVVFNYDVNPKAINQLTTQIKQKFPLTKTFIMARKLSDAKVMVHAKTPSGAHGYYQLPIDAKKLSFEFLKIHEQIKKAG